LGFRVSHVSQIEHQIACRLGTADQNVAFRGLVERLSEDGAMFTSMTGQITLSVAIDIAAVDAAAPADRTLPDARMHDTAPPLDVARKASVDG
jgi:hypothetical protein